MIASFDLYYLLVENVFGNIFMAGMGIAAFFFIMGVFGKMSIQSILFIVIPFVGIFMVGTVGALAAVPIFAISAVYMVFGIINFIKNVT